MGIFTSTFISLMLNRNSNFNKNLLVSCIVCVQLFVCYLSKGWCFLCMDVYVAGGPKVKV